MPSKHSVAPPEDQYLPLNARPQALPMAGATEECRLSAVACRPMFGSGRASLTIPPSLGSRRFGDSLSGPALVDSA